MAEKSTDRPSVQSVNGNTELVQKIRSLESRIQELEARLPSVRCALLHRGFHIQTENPLDRVLLPPDPAHLPDYLRLLRRYSFRLLLRDVIAHKRSFHLEDLLHYCSKPKALWYVHQLELMGLVQCLGEQHWQLRAANPVLSFGETLEWYVAQVLEWEFAIPASWSVSIRQLTNGGDFDVLGVVDGRLLYVETKSSPPKNIHMEVVEGFARRLHALRPQLTIFLVDTHLRMEDKINKMLRAALFPSASSMPRTLALSRRVFRLAPGIYAMNTKPEIRKNLALCLRDALSG